MENVTASSYSSTPAIDRGVWTIAAVVTLGPLMTNLDSTIVNVSLSTLGSQLHAPLTEIQWVTSGYLLALALMLPITGWLVDRLGAKRIYLGCFTAFTITSLLCGTATSASSLIAFRVLQGMAGGVLTPMAQMMLARTAGPNMHRVLSVLALPILIGPILGPIVAGAILQHASWRWIFFINLPIGIVATVLAVWLLPKDTDETVRRPFDVMGFLLLSPALVLFLHGLEHNAIEVGVAIALLAGFGWHAMRRGKDALIDLDLFRDRTFSVAGTTQFLNNATMFGGQLLVPLYLLTERGASPSSTGFLLLPAGLGMLLMYPMMGRLIERFGPRRVASLGAVVCILGTLPLALLPGTSLPMAGFCVALFVRACGQASIGVPSISSAYTSIPRPLIPVATTALNIVQRLGGPVGTTILATFLHARGIGGAHAQAFAATFWLLIGIQALACLSALRLPIISGAPRPQPR
jgi:EmrB/QacA subfamily drug resistance transporter